MIRPDAELHLRAAIARIADANHRAFERLPDAAAYGLTALRQAFRGLVDFLTASLPF